MRASLFARTLAMLLGLSCFTSSVRAADWSGPYQGPVRCFDIQPADGGA